MRTSFSSTAAAVSVCLFCLSTASLSFAETQWQENHPRRVEVNSRLKNQNERITNKVESGQMTHSQAKQLRQNDKAIRSEEREMASQNGGHITKQEKRTLNQQENANSRKIRNQ